ncbi:DUF4344 domain-containing metallopeptidase [Nonomuraea sp. LPB2021202275-12-8]|uniref:DUF4344 domain-containing metallopeptidase n=1 Tax=Nonomuraea sp. LPB2021202275-12-8 TaxID=3120159 RepID=UPI00300D101B
MPHPQVAGATALVLGLSPLVTAPVEPSVRYEAADSAQSEQARRVLQDSGALTTTTRLPEPISVVARDCDSPEATWDREERRITICYSLVTRVQKTLQGISETEEADARTTTARVHGALSVLFHHKLGHALASLHDLDGGEELADRFAALTLTASRPPAGRVVPAAEARHLLAWHGGVPHLKGPARSATFACLVYGADTTAYGRVAKGGSVPPERTPTCAAEHDKARTELGGLAGVR